MQQYFDRFDVISFEIQIYLDPKIYNGDVDTSHVNKKRLEKYRDMIHSVTQSFRKVRRYVLFFAEFYPPTENITKQEALEHHIHSYLQDLTLLSNKIEVLLNNLKNDLQSEVVESDRQGLRDFLDEAKAFILKAFKGVKENRNPHHHQGHRFLDPDVVRSQSIQTMIQKDSPFLSYLKEGAKEHLEEEANKSFESAKKEWCEMAEENDRKITELIERVFLSMEDMLYKYLSIEPVIMTKLKKSGHLREFEPSKS